MTLRQEHRAIIVKEDESFHGLKREELEAKIKEVLAGMKTDGKSLPSLILLGRLYYEAGRLDEALGVFREARRLDGNNVDALNNLSVIYYEKGLLDAAMQCCEDSLEADTRQAGMHNNVGVILSEQGNWEDAVKHYEKAVDFSPDDATLHANLGSAYAFLGRTMEAKLQYGKALELDPNHVTAHYCLGMEVKSPGFFEVGKTINVGTLLKVSSRLVYKGREGREAQKVFSSRIEDISDSTVTVAAPLLHGDVIPFRPGMGVVIGTPGEDALYGFYTKILSVKKDAGVSMLVLSRPKAPQRVQRRKYVRAGSSVLKSARILNTHEVHALHTVRHRADKNISAGGLLMTSSKALPQNTVLLLEITLPAGDMKVAGRVVRSIKNERGEYEVGIQFVGLTEKERARLLHFVQARQIEGRKLGISDKKAVTPKGRIPSMAKGTRKG